MVHVLIVRLISGISGERGREEGRRAGANRADRADRADRAEDRFQDVKFEDWRLEIGDGRWGIFGEAGGCGVEGAV